MGFFPFEPFDKNEAQKCNIKKQNLIDDLLQIQVNEYTDKWGDSYNCEDKWWGDKKLTWEADLVRAWKSRLCNGIFNGKLHGHQCRVADKLPEGLRVSLNDNIQPESFNSFHDLYSWVESIATRVKGIGPTTTYDVARRLGVWRELKPEMVYLHAGAAKGAKRLGVIGNKVCPHAGAAGGVKKLGRIALLSNFPKEIQELGATHAENFLCIYKDAIRTSVNVD